MNPHLEQALKDLKQLYAQGLLPDDIYHQHITQLLERWLIDQQIAESPQSQPSPNNPTTDTEDEYPVYDLCDDLTNIISKTSKQAAQLQYNTAIQLESQPIFFDQVFADTPAPNMAIIPAGRFWMGSEQTEAGHSNAELPYHEVIFKHPFAMATCPITYTEYALFCQHAKYKKFIIPKDKSQHPITHVMWQDAVAYTTWLSEQCHATYRLPTEAEWEYAARAGTTTPFYFGETIDMEQANYDASYIYRNEHPGHCRGHSLPVASFPSNAWGLYDMHGNIWEWLTDCWHETYQNAPCNGSAWLENDCEGRVVRGGSWQHGPGSLRCAQRGWNYPDFGYEDVGFRIVRELE